MARRLRIQFPGALYHVINRGNYRRDVFETADKAAAFERCLFETADSRTGSGLQYYNFQVRSPFPSPLSLSRVARRLRIQFSGALHHVQMRPAHYHFS